MAKAAPKAAKRAPQRPVKQIYEVGKTEQTSQLLGASGVAAYVVSAMGTNRGFLLKNVNSSGFADSTGMSEGDVLLSFNNRVVQTAQDVDRVLGSTPSGNVRVMFVHPGDSGLQLYNGNCRYTNQGGYVASTAGSGAPIDLGPTTGRLGSKHEIQFLASAESYAIELINHDRSTNGVHTQVHANAALTQLARAHAQDMIKRNFFAHSNPDGLGPQQRAANQGIRGGVSENIAMQTGSNRPPSTMVAASEREMMAEPPNQQNHRSNILGPNHQSVGVGVAFDGLKLTMVQEFSDGDP